MQALFGEQVRSLQKGGLLRAAFGQVVQNPLLQAGPWGHGAMGAWGHGAKGPWEHGAMGLGLGKHLGKALEKLLKQIRFWGT